jgi:hypothetical protein
MFLLFLVYIIIGIIVAFLVLFLCYRLTIDSKSISLKELLNSRQTYFVFSICTLCWPLILVFILIALIADHF